MPANVSVQKGKIVQKALHDIRVQYLCSCGSALLLIFEGEEPVTCEVCETVYKLRIIIGRV
jgi:hypothetical protein